MVAEILLLRRIEDGPALFILPYVSVVTEKEAYLKDLTKDSGYIVKGFYGGSTEKITDPFDIGICTIEKANMIVNTLS